MGDVQLTEQRQREVYEALAEEAGLGEPGKGPPGASPGPGGGCTETIESRASVEVAEGVVHSRSAREVIITRPGEAPIELAADRSTCILFGTYELSFDQLRPGLHVRAAYTLEQGEPVARAIQVVPPGPPTPAR
jgi:hypothetical protein